MTELPMQLWWGNAGGWSTLKLEVCAVSAAQEASDLLKALEESAAGGVDASLFSHKDLALAGCHFTTEISGLFQEQRTCLPAACYSRFAAHLRPVNAIVANELCMLGQIATTPAAGLVKLCLRADGVHTVV